MNPLLTRKEISQVTGLTVDFIRKNENALGLNKARRQVTRSVFYSRAAAEKALRSRRFLPQ